MHDYFASTNSANIVKSMFTNYFNTGGYYLKMHWSYCRSLFWNRVWSQSRMILAIIAQTFLVQNVHILEINKKGAHISHAEMMSLDQLN